MLGRLEQICRNHKDELAKISHLEAASGVLRPTGHALMAFPPDDEQVAQALANEPPPKEGEAFAPTTNRFYEGDAAVNAALFERINSATRSAHVMRKEGLMLDGEVNPVLAFWEVKNHPRYLELTADDINLIKLKLLEYTKCYG